MTSTANLNAVAGLGGRIALARLRRGWSQARLARVVGVARTTINGAERRNSISLPNLCFLSKGLDVTTDWLLGLSAEGGPANEHPTEND